MTGKQRIDCILKGQAPDKVPIYHGSVSSRVARRIMGREMYVGGGINQYREAVALWEGPDAHAEFESRAAQDAIDIAMALEHDLLRPGYWRDRRKPASRVDELTFRYETKQGEWEVKRYDPATELYNTIDCSKRFKPEVEDLEAFVEKCEENAEKYAPQEKSFSEFLWAQEKVGDAYEVRAPGAWTAIPIREVAWLEAMVLCPEVVGRYLDTLVTTSLKNIVFLAARGARLFFGGGDFAADSGPMYSPRAFRELVMPRLKRISDLCDELGVYHLFGTDGNVWPVADELYVGGGVHGHYELDRRAGMDIRRLHEKYPHITMVGNIASFTLHTGTTAEVEAEVRACLDEARATDKVIAGCSNIIITDTPPENVDVMMKTISGYR